MSEPDKLIFLVNDKRSNSVDEEHNKVKGLTLEDIQTFINSEIPIVTGPQGSIGVVGYTGPAGPTGPIGPDGSTGTSLFETQYVETLMRTPVDIALGPTGVTSINITEGTTTQYGTLSSVVGSTVTYTPNARVPRYPERNSSDVFTYTGIYNGYTVTGIIHINVRIATPTNKYLMATASGELYAAKYVGSNVTHQQITGVSSWSNMIATNNIDGIVIHAESESILRYWDPVDGSVGSIDISSYSGYVANYDSSEGATFDNDNGFLYIFSQPTTGSPSTVWFYRISFKTFETGGPLVVSNIDVGAMFNDIAFSSIVEEDDFGDVAWDPISKRIWGSSTDNGFFFPNNYLWYINTLSLGVSSSLGNDPPYIAAYQNIANTAFGLSQISFSYDGSVFLRYGSGRRLYSVDVRTLSSTLIDDDTILSYLDLATWPVTLDEDFV